MQLAGSLPSGKKAVISVDAGPLHIAAAVGTPTYAIVGNDGDGMGGQPGASMDAPLQQCHAQRQPYFMLTML